MKGYRRFTGIQEQILLYSMSSWKLPLHICSTPFSLHRLGLFIHQFRSGSSHLSLLPRCLSTNQHLWFKSHYLVSAQFPTSEKASDGNSSSLLSKIPQSSSRWASYSWTDLGQVSILEQSAGTLEDKFWCKQSPGKGVRGPCNDWHFQNTSLRPLTPPGQKRKAEIGTSINFRSEQHIIRNCRPRRGSEWWRIMSSSTSWDLKDLVKLVGGVSPLKAP